MGSFLQSAPSGTPPNNHALSRRFRIGIKALGETNTKKKESRLLLNGTRFGH